MKDFLLIDFGASRIKTALLINDEITNVCDYSSIPPCDTKNNKYEVPVEKLKETFIQIVETNYLKHKYDGILICSEMHGFLVTDNNNQAKSNYISWKTERSTLGNPSDFDILKSQIEPIFLKKTGMNPRACYPIFNLCSMTKNGEFTGGKIVSLPEWIATLGGKSTNKAHVTMSAGLGFYNIYTNQFDKELVDVIKSDIFFNDVVKDIEIAGFISIKGDEIPIYTGVGDHQCAVLGAGNDCNTISVNLGTGSQVAIINLKNDFCEKRPFFNGDLLSVITHIPSGRMLNSFINFLKTINPNTDFWQELDNITIKELTKSNLNMDLSIFKSAWNYTNGSLISNINEDNFTKENYMASLLRNYIFQYKNAIEKLHPDNMYNKIVLSGGIPSKLPIIKEYLNIITDKKYTITYNKPKYDETLLGLQIISKKYIKGD